MITGFDKYEPGRWQAEGLIVPVSSVEVTASSKREKDWKVSLTASIFSVGVSLVTILPYFVDSVGATVLTSRSSGKHVVRSAFDKHLDAPPGYWNNVVTVLRAAPILPEDNALSDPEPIA